MLNGFPVALAMLIFARETVNTVPSATVNGFKVDLFDMIFLLCVLLVFSNGALIAPYE